MATPTEIADLRRMINEPTTATYSDDALGDIIDASANLSSAASSVWTEKAARYAGLVDVSEGSSRRSLGDLYEQALSMATHHASIGAGSTGGSSRARTRAIERP